MLRRCTQYVCASRRSITLSLLAFFGVLAVRRTAPRTRSGSTDCHEEPYFRTASERDYALAMRTWIGERFSVQLGRVHDAAIGPHTSPMYQIAFARALFDPLVPWLMLNRGELSVLVHPNTGRDRSDHLVHALWLGERLAIRDGVLSDSSDSQVSSPVEPNTKPTRTPERLLS